jgi:RNA polymerase sigma factor (sigma-70 family)
VDFSAAERIGFENRHELLDFHAALTRLAGVKPRWCAVVELRVFGGWSIQETAVILKVSESTIRRRWANARRWLRKELAVGAYSTKASRQPH